MRPWFAWISWINPVAYAFEGLLVNELHGRDFPCSTSSLVPSYPDLVGDIFICSVRGALPGETAVSGDAFLGVSYQYYYSHLWRNFGVLWGFLIFFLVAYLIATELNAFTSSTAEVLVFRYESALKQASSRDIAAVQHDVENMIRRTPATVERDRNDDMEIRPVLPEKYIFTWRNVSYDITIKRQPRRLLDHVSGYVKPGTLTALMGVSGAGKTTLLDTLAKRTSVGVVTGDMFVNGRSLDSSFQRKIGYVQQQDLHLETSTVREALQFSAMLRQPKTISQTCKYLHVERVIEMLDMHEFADAVVGIPGEGLNVEQRKLLSIGVELAAKPEVLIFLDEPTSGLDSQSSWAIVSLMRKLANHGQAILATIHQPSSMLFLEFDRLLFLAKGGQTVYFGNIGPNASELLSYFESRGARRCGTSENPAEYMLEIIGAGARGQRRHDWASLWKESESYKRMNEEIDRIHHERSRRLTVNEDAETDRLEFAMPFLYQLYHVLLRVFQQYWRTPTYIYGKFFLGVISGLFIGFSFFQIEESVQGLQNAIFSNFLVLSIFSTLVQQIMPRFVTQRSLYEVRERPSKVYSWAAFLFANILVEIPYQVLLGIMVYGAYFYSVFGVESSERQCLVLLFMIEFFLFASTFAHMLIAGLPDAETAGQLATVLFSLSLVFNGVMQPPEALPGFWMFMWRVSPLTYFVQGITGSAMTGRQINCTPDELSIFEPPSNQTCGTYLTPFLIDAPGRLRNPTSTTNCSYCPLSNTDQFLAVSGINYSTRWRNFGLLWAYITFNIFATIIFYYSFRVKKWSILSLKYLPAWLRSCLRPAGYAMRSLLVSSPKEDKIGREAQNDRLF
jgi:ATP-binding cassette subfamily G (WHITE) protein 2 (PDR)